MMRLARNSMLGALLVGVLLGVAQQPAYAGELQERRAITLSPASGPAGSTVTVTGTGWAPDYYASGVEIGFYQNFGNGVLTPYADEQNLQPDADGRFTFETVIPADLEAGDVVSISGLIGNGSGERANFTVTGGGSPPTGGDVVANLAPTAIVYDAAAAGVGSKIFFDSGVVNNGGAASDGFNIKWFVDGQEVGAYGSHDGVPAGTEVLDGNSQFEYAFPSGGSYQVEFRVDVDGHVTESDEANNSTKVTVAVGFECVRGPDGGCNGTIDTPGRSDAPTWNEYLTYLDGLYSLGQGIDDGADCAEGVVDPRRPDRILGCLGLLVSVHPALELAVGTVLDGASCGVVKKIDSCVGISLTLLRGVVAAIRGVALVNPDVAELLEQRMPI